MRKGSGCVRPAPGMSSRIMLCSQKNEQMRAPRVTGVTGAVIAAPAQSGAEFHRIAEVMLKDAGHLWLRRERIEKAAALLSSGKCNVSEAALEVGYQSFSHFSRAFFEEKGIQPSRWGK